MIEVFLSRVMKKCPEGQCNIYNMSDRVVLDIQTRAKGDSCTSDTHIATTRTRMLSMATNLETVAEQILKIHLI